MGQPEGNRLVDYLSKLGRLVIGILGGLVAFYLRHNVALAAGIFALTCGLIAVVTWWQPILGFVRRKLGPSPPERRLMIRAQEVELDIGSEGTLNHITTQTTVENVSNQPVDRHAHSFRSIQADISKVDIQASDNVGQLKLEQLYPSSPNLQCFCVFFRQHLAPHQTYTYFWSVSNIPDFFKEWWWDYSPNQVVDAFSLNVVHPTGTQISRVSWKIRPYDTILGNPLIKPGTRPKTGITQSNVQPGIYRLERQYS